MGAVMSPQYVSQPDKMIFNNRVWDIVRQIPYGEVATYGQIASLLSPPEGVPEKTYKAFGPRWVGSAMAACPDDIPWHRVINAQGKISLRGGGDSLQRQLLEGEGVRFDERDRVNLIHYQWNGKLDEKPTGGLND